MLQFHAKLLTRTPAKDEVGSSIITKKRSGSDSFTETSSLRSKFRVGSLTKVKFGEVPSAWGWELVKFPVSRSFGICPKFMQLFKLVPLLASLLPLEAYFWRIQWLEGWWEILADKLLPYAKRSQIHTSRRPQSHPHHTHRPKIHQPELFARTLWCPLQVSETWRQGNLRYQTWSMKHSITLFHGGVLAHILLSAMSPDGPSSWAETISPRCVGKHWQELLLENRRADLEKRSRAMGEHDSCLRCRLLPTLPAVCSDRPFNSQFERFEWYTISKHLVARDCP